MVSETLLVSEKRWGDGSGGGGEVTELAVAVADEHVERRGRRREVMKLASERK